MPVAETNTNQFESLIEQKIEYKKNEFLLNSYKTRDFVLFNNNCIDLMSCMPDNCIDMIFADPPYMLSNNGTTCKNGKLSSVNKGEWDKSKGVVNDFMFHEKWIKECRRVLKPEGTIWISGTYHSIYQCGYLLDISVILTPLIGHH